LKVLLAALATGTKWRAGLEAKRRFRLTYVGLEKISL